MPDPALPQPRPTFTSAAPRALVRRLAAPRALAPSGRLGLGTQPLGITSLGAGRNITVRVTAVRTRTVTTTARLS